MKNTILTIILLFMFSVICSCERSKIVDHEFIIREKLSGFLDLALHEFTQELGSSTEPWGPDADRWERSLVEPELLNLAALEFARLDAFADGLQHERDDAPILKPPTPRSLWLPIPAEGSYTYEVSEVIITGDSAVATVQFTMSLKDKKYPRLPVEYRFHRDDNTWLIINVVSNEGYNLREYLKRPHIMKK